MTLPSLKNRQITPRSILRSNRNKVNLVTMTFACLGFLMVTVSTGFAEDSGNAGKIRLVSAQQAERSLENLKHRSASERIQELRNKFGWETKMLEQPVSLETPKPVDVDKHDPIRLFPVSERKLLGLDDKKAIPSFDLPKWEFTDQKSKQDLTQPKQIKTKDDPNALKKIGEIEPYADYAPPLAGEPKTKKTREPGKDYPEEKWPYREPYKPREFEESVFAWEPSNLFYNPLYFEDAPLERYGHAYPEYVQPFVSVGRFGVQLLGLPYQMSIDPVHSCQSPLGWYRPGECAPKLIYQIPWNTKAALTEAGVLTGLFFIIP